MLPALPEGGVAEAGRWLLPPFFPFFPVSRFPVFELGHTHPVFPFPVFDLGAPILFPVFPFFAQEDPFPGG